MAGRQVGCACVVLIAWAAAAPSWPAETYTMDRAHSTPEFSFSHLGMTTQSGRFDRAEGVVVLDLAARQGSVSYEVDAGSLNMGFGTESADSPGLRLFKVPRYPKIRYVSRRLVFDAQGRVVAAAGRLTMLGVERPLTVQVAHFQCAPSPLNQRPMCSAEITAVIRRSEFGMLEYLPGISDEITVHVPVEAYRGAGR
jgi:polyisoprenoid-binding protein YceI